MKSTRAACPQGMHNVTQLHAGADFGHKSTPEMLTCTKSQRACRLVTFCMRARPPGPVGNPPPTLNAPFTGQTAEQRPRLGASRQLSQGRCALARDPLEHVRVDVEVRVDGTYVV